MPLKSRTAKAAAKRKPTRHLESAVERPESEIRLNLNVEPQFHRELKVIAASEGVSIKEAVLRAVEAHYGLRHPRRGKRPPQHL